MARIARSLRIRSLSISPPSILVDGKDRLFRRGRPGLWAVGGRWTWPRKLESQTMDFALGSWRVRRWTCPWEAESQMMDLALESCESDDGEDQLLDPHQNLPASSFQKGMVIGFHGKFWESKDEESCLP